VTKKKSCIPLAVAQTGRVHSADVPHRKDVVPDAKRTGFAQVKASVFFDVQIELWKSEINVKISRRTEIHIVGNLHLSSYVLFRDCSRNYYSVCAQNV